MLLLHVENPFIFYILTISASRHLFEKVNLVQTDLKKYFERIIVLADVFTHQFIQLGINLQELIIILAINLSTCAVINRNDCSRSLATVEHSDFAEVRSSIEQSHLSLFEPIPELVPNHDFALSLCNEIQVVIFSSDRIVLLTEHILWRV